MNTDITLEDCIRAASDVYFPKVKMLYPEIIIDSKENKPIDSFYPNSILQAEHGLTRIDDSKPLTSGFFAALYVPTKEAKDLTKPISTGIIAFRGSDDIYDFIHHDLKMAHTEWPQAFSDALKFYKDMRQKYKNLKNLYFTGHSLGGGLAQLMAIQANKLDFACNKRPAICFNAPQVGSIIKKYPTPHLQELFIDHQVKIIRKKLQSSPQEFNDCTFEAIKSQAKMANVVIAPSAFYSAAAFNIGECAADQYNKWNAYFKSLTNDLNPMIREVYEKIAYTKNMRDCVIYGQPGFNCVYDLITPKPSINDIDRVSFKKCYSELVDSSTYDFIYNFNSFFDVVHTCGMPIGNQCTIDIDQQKYSSLWYATELDKDMRRQAELRTFKTLQKEYFLHQANIIDFNKCKLDLQKDLLSNAKIPNLQIFPILKEVVKFKLGDIWSQELDYYVDTQHSMTNLGKSLLHEKELIKTSFEHKNNARLNIINYQKNNPLENFGDSFKEKVLDLIKSSGLYNEKFCERVVL